MTAAEQLLPAETGLPSGYEHSQAVGMVAVGRETLPWLNEPHDLAVAECTLRGG